MRRRNFSHKRAHRTQRNEDQSGAFQECVPKQEPGNEKKAGKTAGIVRVTDIDKFADL